ncbi:MAG: AsmA family protein, partial [Ignavibacteriaceae bacterium]|nr:AsmA family protein [Ignavibacteriaceae bacterium]
IELTDRVMGKYLIEEKLFIGKLNEAKISFTDFGINIPGALKLDKLNGNIFRINDDYIFDDVSIISEDSDFLINGKANNLHYLIFNVEKEINADLTIKSSIFDLPNFLAFDPSIKRDFNYRILDVDVSVIAKTTTSKATKFKSFPEIEFDIRKIHATAENFLPRLEINSGKFKVSENLLGFNMKFDNFKTDFLDGDFNFSGEYNSSKYQPFYIKAKTDFKTISPSILFYDESDTIPEFLTGKLSGSFFVELQFPVDSTILKFVNLKNGDLSYKFKQDTITINSLNFNLNDLYFNDKNNQNELATLSAKVKLSVEKYLSKNLLLDDAKLNFTVKDGVFNIKSNQVKFFGKNARGNARWILSPFAEIPSYQIEYDVDKFYAEEMLATFLEDTMVTGPLNLSMSINSKGTDWNSIVNNMKGDINLSGKDLIFYGLDADKVIDKFKRSQSFNLVDLGAVVLAGPVGLAVTKGTDFALLLVTNSGESSQITNLVSHWELNDGVFIIKDAAFTTNENRIAAKGLIDFSHDSLNLTIALLNKYGCSVFSQNLYGNLDSPALGKVKVVGTILAPVTNLVDDILGNDCVPFYNGSVNHPKK